MKQLLLIICGILFTGTTLAQMSSHNFIPKGATGPTASTNASRSVYGIAGISGAQGETDAGFNILDMPTFGIYGIGNTNTETFNSINASGKISGYIRPYKGIIWGRKAFVDINFGFNANATNTDSLAVNTILFPDNGNNSFSCSVVLNRIFFSRGSTNFYFLSPFIEFSNKNIKGRNADIARSFYTINTSVGVNFQYLYSDGKDQVSFTVSPYLATVNIPDPGKGDYRYLLTGDENSTLKSTINSWGAKVAFQYNYFQIFADFRTVMGKDEDFPVTGLKGFHQNIGIVFNAEIFEK